MDLSTLTAISPIDGRYRNQIANLSQYFSEYGLIRYRVLVEIEYFIALAELPLPQLEKLNKSLFPVLRKIYEDFSLEDAAEIKKIEKTTNHDVKAVEYFIKTAFDELKIGEYSEFIHFGLTSQDINNTSIPLLLKEALEQDILPMLYLIQTSLNALAKEWKNVPMLARTHGQPASPTKLGKEIMVFSERIQRQTDQLKSIPFSAKFGGATGNFNAHYVAYPKIDWIDFANNFVNNNLGLFRSQFTTQIEHYDNLGAIFDCLKRINTILIDLNRDMWQYISMEFFKQKIKEGEIGSSAMPHKVNPIDFENSEGNLGLANAIFEHLTAKLPVSRLQRDLTDSTVLRNIGVPLAHTYIAFKSLIKGLEKIELNQNAINDELERNWVVIAEGIQTILRREGYPKPYEALKGLTRKNEKVTSATFEDFIQNLNVSDQVKDELKKLSPFNYTGVPFKY
ncbi:MAG: adenylosuccinate lyase [Cytophagaceae bacterium]